MLEGNGITLFEDRSLSCECSHAPKNQENELSLQIANRARAAHDKRQPARLKPVVFSSNGLGPSVCGEREFCANGTMLRQLH
jgi:hypothetical protein